MAIIYEKGLSVLIWQINNTGMKDSYNGVISQ